MPLGCRGISAKFPMSKPPSLGCSEHSGVSGLWSVMPAPQGKGQREDLSEFSVAISEHPEQVSKNRPGRAVGRTERQTFPFWVIAEFPGRGLPGPGLVDSSAAVRNGSRRLTAKERLVQRPEMGTHPEGREHKERWPEDRVRGGPGSAADQRPAPCVSNGFL